MSQVTGKLEAVEREKKERQYRRRQYRLFLKAVSNLGADDGTGTGITASEDGRADLFLALVDKVVLGDGQRFILRDGTEWEA